jgi:hypothetical protein
VVSRAGVDAVVKRESHPLPGLEPPIIHPIAQRYTTELSRLLKWSKNYINDRFFFVK